MMPGAPVSLRELYDNDDHGFVMFLDAVLEDVEEAVEAAKPKGGSDG